MNLGLYYRTLRHLTLRQLVFQVWNRLRGRPRLRWAEPPPNDVPAVAFPITLSFLNQAVTFAKYIDWNYAANGKLWTYNLNYFEFLTHKTAPEGLAESTVALIYDFIRQTPNLRDGLEPYPISLRVVNWRRFLLENNINDPLIERHLYAQTALLRSRLEYHLGANHLLENACALLIMAVHFRHDGWYQKAARLLRAELAEQILTDGGHYERSPVYHQLLTDRLLDVYEAAQRSAWQPEPALAGLVGEKIGLMLGWLQAVTFRNGDVPMVNDSAHGVAPTTAQLLEKATYLSLMPTPVRLGESGYRMLKTNRLECFIDVGPVGPDYQPGHAHADTLAFVLHADGQPVLVDAGTSIYQIGERRNWERSTAAHNTVAVAGKNSSEVWSGFRVGLRAKTTLLIDESTSIKASHDGYQSALNLVVTRTVSVVDEETIQITDELNREDVAAECNFFFNSTITLTPHLGYEQAGPVLLTFITEKEVAISKSTYLLATGFNQTTPAHALTATFTNTLSTVLTIRP
jgi:hypothetical protein